MVEQNTTVDIMAMDGLDQCIRRQFPRLSRRQMDIVKHLVEGMGEKEIANAMGITQHTVHVHIKMLYQRSGVTSRGQLLGGIIKGMLAELQLRTEVGRSAE